MTKPEYTCRQDASSTLWFMQGLYGSFSAHCDHKPGRAVSGREAANGAPITAALCFCRDWVFRHSDFLGHLSLDIRHSFVLRPWSLIIQISFGLCPLTFDLFQHGPFRE